MSRGLTAIASLLAAVALAAAPAGAHELPRTGGGQGNEEPTPDTSAATKADVARALETNAPLGAGLEGITSQEC